ncbi:DUF4331 family protein [bacterium]|nr:DUF4331 family protein [bacterium]
MFKTLMSGSGLAKLAGITLTAGIVAAAFHTSAPVMASDHDDGETNIKARNLNLTDLYAFREDWQTGVAGDNGNMIFIMNTNPRSLPRQQYFFNTNAIYSFQVSRRSGQNASVTGVADISFDFNFGTPTNNSQPIFVNIRRFSNGQEVSRETLSAGQTTAAAPLLGNTPAPAPVNNAVATSAGALTVFAGLREDPFFFDVDGYFRTRGFLATQISPNNARASTANAALVPFSTAATAVDFAKGYNVNAIVMRVPIALLLNGTTDRVFDVWETISVPQVLSALQ